MNLPNLQEGLRNHIYILNQVYELKRRLRRCEIPDGILRPLERLEEHLRSDLHVPGVVSDGCGLQIDDPADEAYDERRTDLDADVIGERDGELFVIDVLKPIIRLTKGGHTQIIQRGSVVVGTKSQKGQSS